MISQNIDYGGLWFRVCALRMCRKSTRTAVGVVQEHDDNAAPKRVLQDPELQNLCVCAQVCKLQDKQTKTYAVSLSLSACRYVNLAAV